MEKESTLLDISPERFGQLCGAIADLLGKQGEGPAVTTVAAIYHSAAASCAGGVPRDIYLQICGEAFDHFAGGSDEREAAN